MSLAKLRVYNVIEEVLTAAAVACARFKKRMCVSKAIPRIIMMLEDTEA